MESNSNIPNRGPELLAVDIAFLVTALIANILRCYVRMSMVKGFGVDDWLMAFATVRRFTMVGDFYANKAQIAFIH